MNISWRFIIIIAFFATTALVVFDLLYALEDDPNLSQFEVVDLSNQFNEDVLQHVADVNSLVTVRSDDIGVNNLDESLDEVSNL